MYRDLNILYVDKFNNIPFNYNLLVLRIISITVSINLIILPIRIIKTIPIPYLLLKEKLLLFYSYILYSVMQLISENIPNYYYKLRRLCTKFYKAFGYHEHALFIIFKFIPYLIVSIIFCVDILIHFKFYSFYRYLTLLFIPLILIFGYIIFKILAIIWNRLKIFWRSNIYFYMNLKNLLIESKIVIH